MLTSLTFLSDVWAGETAQNLIAAFHIMFLIFDLKIPEIGNYSCPIISRLGRNMTCLNQFYWSYPLKEVGYTPGNVRRLLV